MSSSSALEVALLKWINTFPIDTTVTSLDDFADGAVLSKILADIDPMYASTGSPSLQELIDGLAHYIRRECPSLIPLIDAAPIRSLATGGSLDQIVELLEIFVMVSVMGPQRGKYVPAITSLEPEVQGMIAQLIQKKEQYLQDEANADPAPPDDAELEFEQRYGEILAQKQKADRENDHLKKTMADLNTRLETLNMNYEKLQSLLAETQDTLARSRDEDSAALIQSKQLKIQEQDELIESQETALEQFKVEKRQMQRQIEQLRTSSDRAAQLEDEVQVLKHENTELAKKANTVDRYKQKLEASKTLEKQNKDLSAELAEIKDQMRRYDGLTARNEMLEATHKKYQEINDKYELDLIDMINQKDHLKKEVSRLEDTVSLLRAAKANDERIISELQEQHGHGLTSPGVPGQGLNLEAELGNSEDDSGQSENDQAKEAPVSNEEVARLRAELEDAALYRKHIEDKYNQLFEENTLTTEQLSAIIKNSKIEGSKELGDLRERYSKASKALEETNIRVTELEADLEAKKRGLTDLNATLSAVGKAEAEAVADLKAAQQSNIASLQRDLTKTRGRNKILQADYDNTKSQLVEALLAKDKLSKDSSAAEEDSKKKSDLETELASTKAKIAELTEALTSKQAAEADDKGLSAAKEETDTILRNLQRENALIASAWYDLSSRLQSNNVILQRRADVPRSWLNKQRHMVQATPRR